MARKTTSKARRVTMTDVARLAGVSVTTVSRVLAAPDLVSEDVKTRVSAAMESLSYVPNFLAGGLAANNSRVIALIIPSVRNSAFAVMVEEVTEHLNAQGYRSLIGHSNYSPETEERAILDFLSWSPAGFILVGNSHSRKSISTLLAADIPVVETWESEPSIDCSVGFSHQEVGQHVAHYFTTTGCSKLAVVGTPHDIDPRAAKRARAFAFMARALGARVEEVTTPGRSSPTDGGEGFSKVMSEHPDTDAIFFSNDMLALGGLFEAQRRGIRVPDQVRMCGFGDWPFSAISVPSLSTVKPPRRDIGHKAVDLLLARIKGEAEGGQAIDLGFTHIVRESG